MTTYKIKFVSKTNSIFLIIALLTIFLVGMGSFNPHGLHNTALSILLAVVSIIVAYFLWQIFVTGRIEWTTNDNGVTVIWTKKFMLADNKDFSLKWTEIESISRGSDTNYYDLKIKLVTGETMRFYHDHFTTGDDFQEFIKVITHTLDDKKATANTLLAKIAANYS